MDERFRIYVDRLRSGSQELINESFDPDFFELQEDELSFNSPIVVKGKAYFAEDDVILQLNIDTQVSLNCVVCNERFNLNVSVHDFYHSIEAEEFKPGFYDYKELLRDTILLEIPYTAECHNGNCPERERLKHILSAKKRDEPEPESYHPFAGL